MSDVTLWTRRVADWQASGLSALAYARSKQFPAAELRRWAKTLAAQPKRSRPEATVTLARVVPVSASPQPSTSVSLVVELAGARIVVPPGFDYRSLQSVCALLESRRRDS